MQKVKSGKCYNQYWKELKTKFINNQIYTLVYLAWPDVLTEASTEEQICNCLYCLGSTDALKYVVRQNSKSSCL